MTEADEADRVRRAQAGDTRAFEQLVAEHERAIHHLAWRMTGVPEEARELTQTVFVKAFLGLGSFDPRRRFFSWIYRIALNETLNWRRQRRPVEALDESLADPGNGPEAAAERGELEQVVQAALGELSDPHRQVIVLRHFLDLSYAEMSGVLGIPEKTVKSRLFTARQVLGRILERHGTTEA